MTQQRLPIDALVSAASKDSGQPISTVKKVLLSLAVAAQQALDNDQIVTVPGIVVLTPKSREARIGRNPANGMAVNIPARRIVSPRIVPALTRALN